MIRKIGVTLLSLVILIAVSWSLFNPHFFRIHDYTHVARLVEMRTALDAGHFPVQWTQNFGYGYGMPLFLFYGAVPFYFASILTYLGFSFLAAIRWTFIASGILAFLGMYTLSKRWGRMSGLLAATLYVYAPYRALDLYVRGALNEVVALGILPWIVHAGIEIPHAKSARRAMAPLALWTALLLLTHNLTALMSLPLIGIFLWTSFALQAKSLKEWSQSALASAGGFVLGAILSAFTVLPALVEKNETAIDSILSGYFDFRIHFLYIRQLFVPGWGFGGSNLGPEDDMSFQIGLPILIALGLVLIMLGKKWLPHLKNISKILQQKSLLLGATSLLLAGLAFALTLTHSQPIWEAIPILPFIQFPWRFVGVGVFFTILTIALWWSNIRAQKMRWSLALLLILITIFTVGRYHRPEKFLDHPEDFYYTNTDTIRTNMSSILPDYLPKNFHQDLKPIPPEKRIELTPEPINPSKYELNRPHEILWLGDVKDEVTVQWNIADFPGWHYFINDQEVNPDRMGDGRRKITVNYPIHSVSAQFLMTPIRTWSTMVSVLGLVVWLVCALPARRQK